MLNQLGVLPLQIACQLLVSQNHSALVNVNLDVSPKPAIDLPSGYVVYPEIGAAYKHYNYQVPWNVARKHCVADGGYLAIVDSYDKLELVMNVIKPGSHAHVGFHQLFDTNEWTSLKTGLPTDVIPWRTSSYQGENRLCTAVDKDRGGVIAIPCEEPCSIICEVSLSKNQCQ